MFQRCLDLAALLAQQETWVFKIGRADLPSRPLIRSISSGATGSSNIRIASSNQSHDCDHHKIIMFMLTWNHKPFRELGLWSINSSTWELVQFTVLLDGDLSNPSDLTLVSFLTKPPLLLIICYRLNFFFNFKMKQIVQEIRRFWHVSQWQ